MMRYDLKTLKELAARAAGGNAEDALTGAAAAYAADFLECAESAKIPLNINIMDEEKLPGVAAVIHLRNTRKGMNAEESREDLTRKMAAFEIFAVLNSFNEEEENVAAAPPAALSASPLPVLRTLPKADQNERVFDVYAAMKKTAEGFTLGTDVRDGRFFAGRMLDFHNAFGAFLRSTAK